MEEHLPAEQAPFLRPKKLHCFKRRLAQILPPCFVCLTHKTNPDIKIRANVSNNNVLKPVLDNAPAHVENNLELIKCIQTGDLTDNKALRYPCSLDIVFLYTPKPIEEAITNAAERIQKPILHLSKQDRIDLLTVTLSNMYFSSKGHIFHQSEGLSIDSSISGILAILFMHKRSFLKTTDKRYVDHIYLQTPNGLSLSLIDFKVTISQDGKSSFEVTKSRFFVSPTISH